jgi:hypothetical protein
VKIIGLGTPFWGFIAFLLTSFAKILEEGSTFSPPHLPVRFEIDRQTNNRRKGFLKNLR